MISNIRLGHTFKRMTFYLVVLWFTTLGLLIYCNGFLNMAFSTKFQQLRLIKDYESCQASNKCQKKVCYLTFRLSFEGMYYDNSFISSSLLHIVHNNHNFIMLCSIIITWFGHISIWITCGVSSPPLSSPLQFIFFLFSKVTKALSQF